MRTSSRRKLLLLLLIALAAPSSPMTADAPAAVPDVHKLMAVTLDQSVLAPGDDPTLAEELLRVGEIMIFDRHAPGLPWLASAGMIADAPPDVVYHTVTDFARYPEFMPQTEQARVKEIAPDLYDLEFDIVVRIVYVPIKVVSAVYQYNRPPLRTDWASKDEKLLINNGYWQLVPVDQGRRTIAFYSLYSKINQGLARQILEMDPTVETMATMSTAMLVVRAVKARAEKLYLQAGGPALPARPPVNRSVASILASDPEAARHLAEKGRLVVMEETSPMCANVAAVFDFPPEKLWKWLVDLEGQTGGDPHIKVQVLERDAHHMRARFHWEISLLLTFSADYTLDYQLDPPYHMTWTQAPGEATIKGMKGSWDLIPLDNGQKTLAVFRNTFDLRSLGMLMRALLAIEPTFEVAIQASQNMLVMDNIEECLTLTLQQRQALAKKRLQKLESTRDLDLPKP